MQQTVTETKAQRIERLKREKNAWECLDEVRESYFRKVTASPTPATLILLYCPTSLPTRAASL